jgi:hypothetical protein
MGRVYSVGVAVLLALGLWSHDALAQTQSGRAQSQLKQNYPNPFNPETRIPFVLDASLFEGGKRVVVTLTIVNYLRQVVTYPSALGHPQGNAVVRNLEYFSPGEHETYWDGLDRDGKKVASGLYFAQLVVNGQPAGTIRLVVTK